MPYAKLYLPILRFKRYQTSHTLEHKKYDTSHKKD